MVVMNGHSYSDIDNKDNDSELIIRKRIINHRNKQIETRIQRKIVLEDGVMVSDSGPLVTTKTIEDTRQEFEEYGPPIHKKSDNHNNSNDKSNHHYQKQDKDKSTIKAKSNVDTYFFGYDRQQQKLQKHINSSNYYQQPDLPRYYYGQQEQQESKKKKQQNDVKNSDKLNNDKNDTNQNNATISNNNKMVINSNTVQKDNDFHERDCQYLYEYPDFSRYRHT